MNTRIATQSTGIPVGFHIATTQNMIDLHNYYREWGVALANSRSHKASIPLGIIPTEHVGIQGYFLLKHALFGWKANTNHYRGVYAPVGVGIPYLGCETLYPLTFDVVPSGVSSYSVKNLTLLWDPDDHAGLVERFCNPI